jgi:hypothetical protein
LPKCGSPILRRRHGGGCDDEGQSDHEAVHVLRLQSGEIYAWSRSRTEPRRRRSRDRAGAAIACGQ